MSKTAKSIFAGAAAFLVFASLRNVIPLHNMMFFVAACAVFVSVTVAAYAAGRYLPDCKKNWSRLLDLISIVILAGWMILFYIRELDCDHPLEATTLIRRIFPFPLWFLLMAAGVFICLLLLRIEPQAKQGKARKAIRGVISILFTIAVSVQFYAPNILLDRQGNIYHSHSYTNSIINVAWLTPYGKDMTTNYGHYAILYMPFIKLLHKFFRLDYVTGIFLVSAVLAGISILLFLYVLNHFARRDVVYYLAMLAIGEYYFMLMQGGVYLQVHPHRMLFPILMVAVALWEKKREKPNSILPMIMLTLSMIWSTEIGLVTMAAFALYRWVDLAADGERISLKKAVLLFRELFIYALAPFVLAYLFVNAYNLLAGGNWLNFADYMYPLISEKEYIQHIELALPDVTHAWVGTTALFLTAVSLAGLPILFPKEKGKETDSLLVLIGLLGLGSLLYYINRPVEGCVFIAMFLMLVLQAMVLEKAQDIYMEWKREKGSVFAGTNRFLLLSLRVVTALILVVMAFDSVYSMPGAYKASMETIWKRKELLEFTEHIYNQVPPDALSFGMGVPELMALIDRDTHIHASDWSNVTDTVKVVPDYFGKELRGVPWFFCDMPSVVEVEQRYPELADEYHLHETFEYGEYEYGFFVKNENAE